MTTSMVLILFVLGAVLIGITIAKVKDKRLSEQKATNTPAVINSFDECVQAGNPVMESFPEQCAAEGQTFVNEEQLAATNQGTAFVSGLGAFELILPDGIGEVLKPLDSNALYVMGMKQPDFTVGEKPTVNEVEGFGTDSPSLFGIVLLDQPSDMPRGDVSAYTLVNNKENSIEGKKYTYVYTQDEEVGIGTPRYIGDRDYVYVFDVPGGKQLIVHYSVYGSDPRNHAATIESIIDSIVLK